MPQAHGQIALFETAKGTLIKILITLNTRRPSEHRYRLFGTEGSAEWFSYEGFCRRFDRDRQESEGWERVPIGAAARGTDASTGHGGTDLQLARHFTRALLEGRPAPIDVYRAIEFCLPGIIANRSAEMGRALPFPTRAARPTATRFWDAVSCPIKSHRPRRPDLRRPYEPAPIDEGDPSRRVLQEELIDILHPREG